MSDVRTAISNGLRIARVRATMSSGRRNGPFDGASGKTAVDRYWSRHTVRADRFRTRRASKRYLESRFAEYPLFREFSGLWGDHAGHVILDYGCGPGNDVTGFALYTQARQIIGIDISQAALDLAARRIELHRIGRERVALHRVSDADPALPLADDFVDHVNSQGVLHHTSDPEAILRELARVLRPGGTATIMVYNRDSLWFHLYTAYERMIVEGTFRELDAEQAFARNTDGPACPISRCYRPEDFLGICRRAGLDGEFVGGYLSRTELSSLNRCWTRAVADRRLASEHRGFLRGLTFDFNGLPLYHGRHAGIGGTYRLRLTPETPDR